MTGGPASPGVEELVVPFSHVNTPARRMVVAAAVIALIAMAAGPALAADGGFASVGRTFKVTGDRDRVAVVGKVTRANAGSGLSLGVQLTGAEPGHAGTVTVVFEQGSARPGSRGIKVDGFSMSYKAVQGTGCTYDMRLFCRRTTYDWVEGRAYKAMFTRGGKNGQGWLWTVSVRDLAAAKTTKLVSFRSPADKVSAGEAALYTNPGDCANITPVAAVAKKPTGAGSSVSWGAADSYTSCEDAAAAAPIVKGSAKLSIR